MIVLAFLPEIASFLLLVITAMQMPQWGAVLVLSQFAIAGMLILRYTRAFLDALMRWWWLLLLPLLALVSAFWSDLPLTSVRYAVQLIFTVVVGIALARLLAPERYIQILMLALLVFAVASIASGLRGESANGMVLIGLAGSKNAFAFMILPLLLASIALLLIPTTPTPLRWLAAIAAPLAAYLVFQANSATALLSAVVGCALLIIVWLGHRLTPAARVGAFAWAAIVLLPITALTPEIRQAFNDFMIYDLGKDPTLTGRTFLWERADALIEQSPVVGHGYRAIWMGESTESIALRRISGQEDGRAFNFHDQFRQIAVDLGYLGVIFLGIALIVPLIAGFRQYILSPSMVTSFFFVLQILTIGRALIEVTYFGPFSANTLTQCAAWVYAFWAPMKAAEQQALRWPLWTASPQPDAALRRANSS
ncbi:MAG: O-antigen ligase family protein [Hyphomonadaceae bacterium]|nr:O-antigen ligase family protein [Hyphomonadaceae bacterium]